jgi:hypothetical protein
MHSTTASNAPLLLLAMQLYQSESGSCRSLYLSYINDVGRNPEHQSHFTKPKSELRQERKDQNSEPTFPKRRCEAFFHDNFWKLKQVSRSRVFNRGCQSQTIQNKIFKEIIFSRKRIVSISCYYFVYFLPKKHPHSYNTYFVHNGNPYSKMAA